MTDDLVARLRMLIDIAGRDASPVGREVTVFAPILGEAADEIERLCAIVAELAATHPQNGYYCGHCGTPMNNHALPPDTYLHTPDCLWVCARQAIKETP